MLHVVSHLDTVRHIIEDVLVDMAQYSHVSIVNDTINCINDVPHTLLMILIMVAMCVVWLWHQVD